MATTRPARLHHRLTTAVHRHRRTAAAITAAATVASGLAVGLPGAASTASPSPTIHEVEARIAAINTQAEKITEAYDGARDQLKTIKGKAAAARKTLIKDEQVLGGMRRRISKMATAAYESAGLTAATSLLDTGNPELVIDRTSDLGAVAHSRQAVLTQAVAADRQMEAAKATYDAQVTAEKKTVASIAAKRQQIQGLLAREKQVLSTLKAQQRRELARAAARAHAREVAQRQTFQASHPAPATPSAPASHPTPTYSGPASGSAAAAVRFAYAQLGKPYVYGAAGPDSYDCSGLTMASWAAGGVSLPHNAAAQQATVPAVSLSSLEPGDLVFFGDPAYHVAIYIGGGRIIQAPHTGADVEITPLSYMPPTSAGRP